MTPSILPRDLRAALTQGHTHPYLTVLQGNKHGIHSLPADRPELKAQKTEAIANKRFFMTSGLLI
jgi:hypothetical protein